LIFSFTKKNNTKYSEFFLSVYRIVLGIGRESRDPHTSSSHLCSTSLPSEERNVNNMQAVTKMCCSENENKQSKKQRAECLTSYFLTYRFDTTLTLQAQR